MKNHFIFISFIAVCCQTGFASNLANPSIPLPKARVAVGASYHLGGYSITNLEIPALLNRFHGRIEYGPLRYLTVGFDLGATQVEVERFTVNDDTMPVFHGNYGFSGGAHLKLATPPFLHQRLAVVAIGQATLFDSKDEQLKTGYNGKDGTGGIGIQFHIPGFGYVTAGPWVYLIQGECKNHDGTTEFYSNTDNIRGWLAIDYFPKVPEMSKNKPYISFEFSISPSAKVSKRLPFQAISASISVGSISNQLYGQKSELEWKP